MSQSTLSITRPSYSQAADRVVQVPCRLPDSFTFWFHLPTYGKAKATALLHDYDEPAAAMIGEIEVEVGVERDSQATVSAAGRAASAIMGEAMAQLTSQSDALVLIASAYEAEASAYDACVKAHAALPRRLHSPALLPRHPSEEGAAGITSPAVLMLRKYVEYVFEEACAAQTERAEAQAKVTPIRPVTP